MIPYSLRIADIDAPHFSARCQLDGRALTLSMRGNAESDMKVVLANLLRELDEEAKSTGIDNVVVNMNELYFMTSSCISALVRWISDLADRTLSYRVLFQTNPSLAWQRRTLAPLCALAPGLALVD